MGWKKRAEILEAQTSIGYAYWQVLLRDGRIVNEWDCHWGNLPKGKVEARLVCPNGKLPTVGLGSGKSIDDRLFHFNIAHAIAGVGRATTSYVLGIVYGTNGESIVYAWEPFNDGGTLIGPFEDTFPNMKYGGPVTSLMDAYLLGVKVN